MRISLRAMRTLKDGDDKGVKAASGLVKVGNTFYVIADDEVSLAEFKFEGDTKANYIQLLEKELPDDAVQRKKQKPDWESLVQLEIAKDKKILLAVPSGSTDNRMIGAFLRLDQAGLVDKSAKPVTVDFSEIYKSLKVQFAELNIEGACVLNNKLKLFQRGNGAAGKNAVIDIDLSGFCHDLEKATAIKAQHVLATTEFNLGHLDGHKLDFTDACVVGDKVWFLAVAEDSQSTYDDGQYYGAIIGCLDASGKETVRYEIDCATKPEGLWVDLESQRLCFYVVTDADSSSIFATIYFGKLLF
ncbi:DUF6929 family protein [Pseudobdellovibrio sp. HCB154]|uniref:DUF6929 family protein n=1 Tax=Pseudobdellovibrio sp. HCB154 TaxID=3386277 RepID=UPI003916EF27